MTANRYCRAREIAGLSPAQAARMLGWAQGPLHAIEIGAGAPPTEDEQRRMSEVYGCSIEWLRGDSIEPPADLVKALRDKGVSDHDRDAVLEFAAMIQHKRPSAAAEQTRQALLEGVRIAKEARAAGVEPVYPVDAAVSVARKRRYVRSQGQTRKHHCHWPGCTAQVPPAMWGCRTHWFRLPKALRDRIWATYAPGQEVDMTPSDAYLKVADDVQKWIREMEAKQP